MGEEVRISRKRDGEEKETEDGERGGCGRFARRQARMTKKVRLNGF